MYKTKVIYGFIKDEHMLAEQLHLSLVLLMLKLLLSTWSPYIDETTVDHQCESQWNRSTTLSDFMWRCNGSLYHLFINLKNPTIQLGRKIVQYCNAQYHCYARILGRNTCYSVTVGKHANNIWAIVRPPPVTIIGLLELVFSVRSTPRLYSKNPRPAETSSTEKCEVKWSEVEVK
jgi:hypothetical protein